MYFIDYCFSFMVLSIMDINIHLTNQNFLRTSHVFLLLNNDYQFYKVYHNLFCLDRIDHKLPKYIYIFTMTWPQKYFLINACFNSLSHNFKSLI